MVTVDEKVRTRALELVRQGNFALIEEAAAVASVTQVCDRINRLSSSNIPSIRSGS